MSWWPCAAIRRDYRILTNRSPHVQDSLEAAGYRRKHAIPALSQRRCIGRLPGDPSGRRRCRTRGPRRRQRQHPFRRRARVRCDQHQLARGDRALAARRSCHGATLTIEAFGEEGAPLSVPAPLIRVKEGETVAVSIRNDLQASLRVHGLCARDGAACPPVDVPSGTTRDVRFASGRAGTYHYWATTMNAPVPFRELAGALIVDPRDEEPGRDRIFVITEWTSLTPAELDRFSWPTSPARRSWPCGPGSRSSSTACRGRQRND